MTSEEMRRKVALLSRKYLAAVKTEEKERKRRRSERRRLADVLSAQDLIQSVAAKVQQQAHARISLIVSECLRKVFPDPYTFKITFEKKRGRTEAVLSFVRDGLELSPTGSCSGGALDVAGLALRLAAIQFQKPAAAKLVVADEPFRFVGEKRENIDRVRELIAAMSKEMRFQFVLTTNDPQLEVGKVVQVG